MSPTTVVSKGGRKRTPKRMGRVSRRSSERASVAPPPQRTLLESEFPYRELSLVIKADRRTRDPVYGVHRWWARRPPALLRGLLIASHLGAEATTEDFWRSFGSSDRPLTGQRVLDPFAGGGSTLVEAARLGANVVGSDVDPLAVRIVKTELGPLKKEAVRQAGAEMLAWLTDSFAKLYPSIGSAVPLHYFHVPIVGCPSCSHRGPLYRNLVLARDPGLRGAVVRSDGLTCFCPSCFALRSMKNPDAVRLRCCGRQRSIHSGTFTGHSYCCPRCGAKSSHRDLATGVADRRLVAVEETPGEGRRCFRTPTPDDLAAQEHAKRSLSRRQKRLHLPIGTVQVGHHDDRPSSYGITQYAELFTPRQLLVFGAAWTWMSERDWPEPVKCALELALSNALTTNNRLCGYAKDYGRISGLFTVRGYSLPALSVELNPLHPTGGRGTISACIARIERAAGTTRIGRNTWHSAKRRAERADIELTTEGVDVALACQSADVESTPGERKDIDVCIFDPPYYDYIAYDELSAFYRAWLRDSHLAGAPLLPGKGNGAEPFGVYLGRCMRAIVTRVTATRPIVFTYHSTNPDAWDAIGQAIDSASLRVTSMWPIRSDGHMGHHSHAGNSEWDLVIICRRFTETEPRTPKFTLDEWIAGVRPLRISKADRKNMSLALAMIATRFSHLKRNP